MEFLFLFEVQGVHNALEIAFGRVKVGRVMRVTPEIESAFLLGGDAVRPQDRGAVVPGVGIKAEIQFHSRPFGGNLGKQRGKGRIRDAIQYVNVPPVLRNHRAGQVGNADFFKRQGHG